MNPSLTPEELHEMLHIHFPYLTSDDCNRIYMDHMMMWENDEEETDTDLRNDTRDIAGKAF